MHPNFTDANRTLKFGREKLGRVYFVLGAISVVAGIFLVSFGYDSEQRFAGYVVLALGFALCMYEMHRHFHPSEPLLVLSPTGIKVRIEQVKSFFIPWSEVKGVETIDIEDATGSYPRVTAVLVRKDFYDRHIHVGNIVVRALGWSSVFVPKGDGMLVALHHGMFSATQEEMRTAVETRWKVFGPSANGRPLSRGNR